jgi:hypothetical protein
LKVPDASVFAERENGDVVIVERAYLVQTSPKRKRYGSTRVRPRLDKTANQEEVMRNEDLRLDGM